MDRSVIRSGGSGIAIEYFNDCDPERPEDGTWWICHHGEAKVPIARWIDANDLIEMLTVWMDRNMADQEEPAP